MSAVDALIGFGGSTASSLINYFGQQRQANIAFEHNKELARLSNQMNIDQWKRENAYNSPAAQMARFKAAGLNPNLMTGQQNLSANSPTLSGGSDYVSPNAQMLDPNAANNAMLLKAQIANIEADTAQKYSGVELNQAEIAYKFQQGRLTDAEIDKLGVDMDLSKAQIENLRSMNKQIAANTDYIKKQTDEVAQRIENLKSEKSLTDQQVAEKTIDVANKQKWYTAMIDEIQSRAKCSKEQAKLAAEQAILVGLQGDYQKKENEKYDARYHNEVTLQRYEVQEIASNITRNNASNLKALYGDAAGAIATSKGITQTISPSVDK